MGQGGTVRGADEVARTMGALADDVRELAADVGPDAGGVVVRAAQGFAPRRTGLLRSSIQAVTAAQVTTVTAGVKYAAVQEYGSVRRHIQGRHYMRRAAETKEREVAAVYQSAVDDAANHVKGV